MTPAATSAGTTSASLLDALAAHPDPPASVLAAVAALLAARLAPGSDRYAAGPLLDGRIAPAELDPALVVPDDLLAPELLGDVLDAIRGRDERRRRGAFFTPHATAAVVVERATDAWAWSPRPRVCDPACGGGAFLLAAARSLEARGLSRQEIVRELLWGADSDPLAVATTRATLVLWAAEADGVRSGRPRRRSRQPRARARGVAGYPRWLRSGRREPAVPEPARDAHGAHPARGRADERALRRYGAGLRRLGDAVPRGGLCDDEAGRTVLAHPARVVPRGARCHTGTPSGLRRCGSGRPVATGRVVVLGVGARVCARVRGRCGVAVERAPLAGTPCRGRRAVAGCFARCACRGHDVGAARGRAAGRSDRVAHPSRPPGCTRHRHRRVPRSVLRTATLRRCPRSHRPITWHGSSPVGRSIW